MTEKGIGKHRRDGISNLLAYSGAVESMAQRESLETCGFPVRIVSGSAWMVVFFTTATGDCLREGSWVV
jgi:hypothetical protein